jgi:hypothetical protein
MQHYVKMFSTTCLGLYGHYQVLKLRDISAHMWDLTRNYIKFGTVVTDNEFPSNLRQILHYCELLFQRADVLKRSTDYSVQYLQFDVS